MKRTLALLILSAALSDFALAARDGNFTQDVSEGNSLIYVDVTSPNRPTGIKISGLQDIVINRELGQGGTGGGYHEFCVYMNDASGASTYSITGSAEALTHNDGTTIPFRLDVGDVVDRGDGEFFSVRVTADMALPSLTNLYPSINIDDDCAVDGATTSVGVDFDSPPTSKVGRFTSQITLTVSPDS